MGIELNSGKGVYQAKIQGEMTIYTAGEYREVLLEQCHTQQGLDLDLTEVTEIDASGLQLLVALKKHFQTTENSLRLHNLSECVHDVLELTQLAGSFDDQVEEAQ